jgi:2-iminoacetate synthase
MGTTNGTVEIDEAAIWRTLHAARCDDTVEVREVVAKARERNGLNDADLAVLMGVSDPEMLDEIFFAARRVKEEIYGNRLVLFAPLYVSNLCNNECVYCAFRAANRALRRRALGREEIAREVERLIGQGHKRILLVAGEAYPPEGFDYVLDAIDTVYGTRSGPGEIRRVNVNVAPLSLAQFGRLKARRIGTYQVFQETYHRETYAAVHLAGKKRDFDWRIEAPDRAMTAGIDDVGVGVLLGLFDWRFEVLGLMQHVRHLERRFGVGPHTISVPRIEPATGSAAASRPPRPVSDADFLKLVAILRLAVPYTGIIMSTRENPELRRETFALGVSQISAGSRTDPGGYSEEEAIDAAQFSLGDHRPLDEVVRDVAALGYVPSFCTACYRLGRTGRSFMDLAKPGDIKERCAPNALATFQEYLEDYGSPATRAVAEATIARSLAELPPGPRARAAKMVRLVQRGARDVYC